MGNLLPGPIARVPDARIGDELGPQTGVIGPVHIDPLVEKCRAVLRGPCLRFVHAQVNVGVRLAILRNVFHPVVGARAQEGIELGTLRGVQWHSFLIWLKGHGKQFRNDFAGDDRRYVLCGCEPLDVLRSNQSLKAKKLSFTENDPMGYKCARMLLKDRLKEWRGNLRQKEAADKLG